MKTYEKIMVATDIHGSALTGEKLLEIFDNEKAELLVVMGDFYYHGPRNPLPEGHGPMALCDLLNSLGDKILAIRGNCDAEIDEMISAFPFNAVSDTQVGDKKISFTHGHLYNQEKFPEGSNILMFGHTHINKVYRDNGKLAVNLASCSLPKGGCDKSYAIIEKDKITIKTLGGTITDIIEL